MVGRAQLLRYVPLDHEHMSSFPVLASLGGRRSGYKRRGYKRRSYKSSGYKRRAAVIILAVVKRAAVIREAVVREERSGYKRSYKRRKAVTREERGGYQKREEKWLQEKKPHLKGTWYIHSDSSASPKSISFAASRQSR